jgi:Tol biopolymer transport system component
MRKAWWLIGLIGLSLTGCGPAGYTRIDPGGNYVYFNPAWSPDSKYIAYTRCDIYDKVKGEKIPSCELFVLEVATRQTQRLTDNVVYDGQPTWSPDGTQIAYRREETPDTTRPTANADSLRVIDRDDLHDRELYRCPALCNTPTWSPRGDRIAFQQATSSTIDSASAVFLIRSDGSDLRQLTAGDRTVWKPRWSPDGKQIAFRQASDQPMWLIDVASGQATALEVKGARGPDEPLFAPDGSGIVFSAYGDAQGKRLFFLNFADHTVQPLLNADADYPPDMQEPDWSPDGKGIVFSALHEKLYLADVEQTRRKP